MRADINMMPETHTEALATARHLMTLVSWHDIKLAMMTHPTKYSPLLLEAVAALNPDFELIDHGDPGDEDDAHRRESERRAIEWRQTVEEFGAPLGAVSRADGDATIEDDGISVACPNCGACLDDTTPDVNVRHLSAGCVAAVPDSDAVVSKSVAGTQAYRDGGSLVIICGRCGAFNPNATTPEVYHHLNARCRA